MEANLQIHQLFEQQQAKFPDLVALRFGDTELTYAALNARADVLAAHLKAKAAHASIIGISATRSTEMVAGVLGILKAGKAYLPLDPKHPSERLRQIVAEAAIEHVLCDEQEATFFAEVGLMRIDTDTAIAPEQDAAKNVTGDIAYVLYTSGSTGKPKGVCMGHRALVNLLLWQQAESMASAGTCTLQFSPLGFDVSFQEIFATLCTGGTLVLVEDDLLLEPLQLLQYIESQHVNRLFLPFVALQYITEAAVANHIFPQALREVITAGEQLKITPQIVNFFKHVPAAILVNQYGPTECHVVTSLKLTGNPADWPALPSIGKPISHVDILILDDSGKPVANGEAGELCIGGVCVAEGYLNRADLTDEKFIDWLHPEKGVQRIYKTGDVARVEPDGNIVFMGRSDDQVKISGYRIEPGEIEVLLAAQPGIKQAVVVAREDASGTKQLIAYVQPSGPTQDTAALRTAISERLPYYMMPSAFVWLPDFPKTSSGKVDRKALPAVVQQRPIMSVAYQAPSTEEELAIAAVWRTLFNTDRVGVNDNFFELGGSSLLALRMIGMLSAASGWVLPAKKLFQYPTVAGIARYLNNPGQQTSRAGISERFNKERNNAIEVAIIGMAGRFPGADTISEYWDILTSGKETVSWFSDEELDPEITPDKKTDPDYVRARGIINHTKDFDAAFFGINPKLAELMDPQQRIFLEIAWEALESTGYLPEKYDGYVGVFAGSGNNTYYLNNVLPNHHLVDSVGGFQVMTFNEKDYVASRVAYALNLRGAAVSVHSGCSTSLLAVAQAVDSIRSGQCDIALAGGVAITVPLKSGHIYQEGAMLSKDGHTRPFDAAATGTVFSDGAGVVLLKNKADAERDGDTIFAVIKGIGINNDGGDKGVFTAPSAEGQAGAIVMALNNAGIDSSDISYVEAHGTATPLGDPIELEGLSMAFGNNVPANSCAIGSVKGNIGHLTAAAGVAGLIKTTLALYHQKIPASINFDAPNAAIGFEETPFYVNSKLSDWTGYLKRIAGVSSFGVGGTNVHVVVEEYEQPATTLPPARPVSLICWSAKTEDSREGYGHKLADYLQQHPQVNLDQVGATLLRTRQNFASRRFAIASSPSELAEAIKLPASNSQKELQERQTEVVFLFPGQGSQYIDMGKELYIHEPIFKDAVDECAILLHAILNEDIRKVIYPEAVSKLATDKLNNTRYAQPALFVIGYATAKLWMSWGIQPAALAGHSIGEFIAAHLAGVFSLQDALMLIAERGRLMADLPRGSMLAIREAVGKVVEVLPDGVGIAAVNSPALCVASGPESEIAQLAKQLDGQGISNKLLFTSHAFHSAMMDPVVVPFTELVATISLSEPELPLMSTVSGTWMTDEEATDPAYWANHLRATVMFGDAVDCLINDGFGVMLECGPGNVTSVLAKQNGLGISVASLSSIDVTNNRSVYYNLLSSLGQLWLHGIEPDWKAFYGEALPLLHDLPNYAFQRKRFWVNPPASVSRIYPAAAAAKEMSATEGTEVPATVDDIANEYTEQIVALLERASGINLSVLPTDTTFIEAGLDSLLLTQVAINLRKELSLPVTFRQLNEELNTVALLNAYCKEKLQGTNTKKSTKADTSKSLSLWQAEGLTEQERQELKKPFGASARIEKQASELSATQLAFIRSLTVRYNEKTKASKAHTQQHREHMADPRVVSGFRPLTKEMVYPLIVNRSKGARLWDIDGNEYIDALNGFGSNFLGYQPEVITKALHEQIESGYEIGPQTELAGEVSELICAFTGADRVAFCNTGSEAVLGAMRIARTVTGRSLIVAFSGSYHGINDEVIVRGTKQLKSFPAAPGIMPEAVQNMLILDYGTDESLQIIKERASELAAVLVEPVQSRRPDFQPIEFLKAVRNITEASQTALIFDEVITGFRMHPGGAQALFGIRADLATYGKVIGGGISIGVIGGKKTFMDALDGGSWQFGDDSVPEVGVTYFAGTFVRHPLALAAAKASLLYMKERGGALQEGISSLTQRLVNELNRICTRYKVPFYVPSYGSLWKIKFHDNIPYGELLFTLMREKGIHIWDIFPCFLTEAHTDADVDRLVICFEESVREMVEAGFFASDNSSNNSIGFGTARQQGLTNNVAAGSGSLAARLADDQTICTFKVEEEPPCPGARLGRDKDGEPAWFIADPVRPGKYLQVV